jgi:hypothetical protein
MQHFVLVVTPAALASSVVRREIRLARQEGKTVCPVMGPGLADLGKLPRWIRQFYDRIIRLIRPKGKTVCPVKRPGLTDLSQLPRWLGQIYHLDLPAHRTTLTRVLQDQSRQKGVAMMAPDLPIHFVQRPVEFDALKKQLLDAEAMRSPSPLPCAAPAAMARRRSPEPWRTTPTFDHH